MLLLLALNHQLSLIIIYLILPLSLLHHDTFSLGPFDIVADNFYDSHESLIDSHKLLVQAIIQFKLKHPTIKVLYISPFNIDAVTQLSESAHQDLLLSDIFVNLNKYAFTQLQLNGIFYFNFDQAFSFNPSLRISWLNYLRYRYPFDVQSVSSLRHFFEQILATVFLKNQEIKAISVDLDNTLWLGVAGDDDVQISKIILVTCSFYKKILLKLRSRGCFAISSKNDLETVRATFDKFNDQLLIKLSDFSSIQANWNPKSSSILQHSQILNVAVDSFLHIDDSELELLEISSSLPKLKLFNLLLIK